MENNQTVETTGVESVQDDAVLASQAQDDGMAALSEALAGSAAGTPQGQAGADGGTQAQDGTPAGGQDGQVDKGLQGRINASVRKALAEQQAVYEGTLAEYGRKLTEMQDRYLGQEADALVASGQMKDRDMALDYLRMKAGMPVSQTDPPTQGQQRDEKGRFAPQGTQADPAAQAAPDADVQARAQMLFEQGQAIMESGGPDVMALFNENETVKAKVLAGEWDFKDAALWALTQPGAKHVPSTVRSPNHTNMNRSFGSMGDKEFEAFNKRLENGEVFDARR